MDPEDWALKTAKTECTYYQLSSDNIYPNLALSILTIGN